DPANLEVIQRWQDESLQLFVEVARGGERREWWEGFLASYYKIALPLGLRPSSLPVCTRIFAWRSGEASASNACATPSMPTRPVISGVVGIRPSAMWPSVAANSSCV